METRTSLLDTINAYEKKYPVHEWILNGVHIWPILRIRTNFSLLASSYLTPSREKTKPLAWRVARKGLDSLRGVLFKAVYSFWMDGGNNSPLPQTTQAIFLSDGASFAPVNGKKYDKFCSPMIDYLKTKNVSTFLICPTHQYQVPRHSPSRFIQSDLDRVALKTFLKGDYRKSNLDSLPGFVEFSRDIRENFPLMTIDESYLKLHAAIISRSADYFQNLLERLKPSVGFLVSYYGTPGYAFNLACRRVGIPSIDIQHGVAGDLHIAYGRWTALPKTGYNILPSLFWCWSPLEKDSIDAWAFDQNQAHRAVVGHNLFLELFKSDTKDFIGSGSAEIQKIMEKHLDKRHIIFCAQFTLQSESIRLPLLEVIENTPSLLWWIRLPPNMTQENQRKLEKIFSRFTNVELRLATDLPLYTLFKHMEVHVTHYSSTCLEAREFGIRTIFTGSWGAELFPRGIRSGSDVLAATPRQIQEALLKFLNLPPSVKKSLPDEGKQRLSEGYAVLDRILAEACGRRKSG